MRHFVSLLLLLAISTAAEAHILWRGDFETGDLSQWSGTQEVSPDRLQVVTDPVRQGQYALRATVRQGDNPISASGNRNELFLDNLEREGSEYFYRWSTMFDPTYPSEQTWQVFTQWHQNTCCGSPPVEFDVLGEELQLHNNDTLTWSTPLIRGVWHDFVFHVKWSADPSTGFEELWYDGQLVIPKRSVATGADTYLKQGVYRNATIAPVGIVFHDGFIKGETYDDVVPPQPPPGVDAGAPAADAGLVGASGTLDSNPDAGAQPAPPPTVDGQSSTDPSTAPPTGGCSSTGSIGGLLAGQAMALWLTAQTRRRGRGHS